MSIIRIGDVAFICDDPWEKMRALSLDTKEPGTIAWLRATLKPGDVFYDIGANIGCYSLVAAQLVGSAGHVYAFEPHVFNAAALLRNIQANGLQDVITVVTTPLGAGTGLQPLHYTSLRAGSSGHQLGEPISETGQDFVPKATVIAQSLALDDFELRAADVMKIDVDGSELEILGGMLRRLMEWPLRSLQVEMHVAHRGAIVALLARRGYHLTQRHYTQAGQKAVDAGSDPDAVTDNAIFARVAVYA